MLDRLLGRAELKERIEELEAEKESLEERLEAESERRSEAVSDRQQAERRVNELEDRVTELEDRVERLQGEGGRGGEGGEPEFRGRLDLRGERRDRVLALLDSVESTEEGVLTAYVPDDPPAEVREAFGDRAPLVERAAPCLVVRDSEGLLSAALRPPNPPEAFREWASTVRFEREWLAPTGRYALAVVRSDLFALGVFEAHSPDQREGEERASGERGEPRAGAPDQREGEERESAEGRSPSNRSSGQSPREDGERGEPRAGAPDQRKSAQHRQPERVHFEGFESDVKGKHSKGGFSQDRFERRRESQIREHLDDCQNALADVDADRVFVVGESTLLEEFDADATAAVDATGKPEAALEDAHDAFWTVSLSLL